MASTVKKESLPSCDICRIVDGVEAPAAYDIKTRQGPWANVCPSHFEQESPEQRLGTGIGQMFLLPEDTYLRLANQDARCPYCLEPALRRLGGRDIDIDHDECCPRVFDLEEGL